MALVFEGRSGRSMGAGVGAESAVQTRALATVDAAPDWGMDTGLGMVEELALRQARSCPPLRLSVVLC